jgi:hypothetical protein
MNADRIRRKLREFSTSGDIDHIQLILLEQNPDGGKPIEDDLERWPYVDPKDVEKSSELAQNIFDSAQCITDDMARPQMFYVAAYDRQGKRLVKTKIKQQPEKETQVFDASTEGQIGQAMRHMENAYRMVTEVQSKHSNMYRDVIEATHKRMKDLEKQNEVLQEIVRDYRMLNVDQEDKIRREERYDKFFTVIAEVLTPAVAEKLSNAGILGVEEAAALSATGKAIGEEISGTNGGTPPSEN